MLTTEETLALIELLEEVEQESAISLLNLARDKKLSEESQQLLNERVFFCQFFIKRFSEDLEMNQDLVVSALDSETESVKEV